MYVLVITFIVHLVMVPGNESKAVFNILLSLQISLREHSMSIASSCLNVLGFSCGSFFDTVMNKTMFEFY